MKNLFIPICFGILLFGCKKTQEPVPPVPDAYFGTSTVQKNGATWTCSPYAGNQFNLPNHIFLEFDSIDNLGIIREACYVGKVPLIIGTYPVENSFPNPDISKLDAFFQYRDGDYGYGKYDILKSDSSSFVTLSSYDAATGAVTGTFDLTFIAVYLPYPLAPDTIRLRNGVFHTKIIK